MKVVGISNHDDETVDDVLVEERLTQEMAEKIATEHNLGATDHSSYWFVVKPNDYKLHRWKP